jgi:hypothetical protein
MKLVTCLAPAAAVTAAVVVATAVPATAHGGHGHGAGTGPSPRLLAEARAATAAFHDPVKAIAAGYLPTDHCEPGMGQHWVNPGHLADGVHDVSRPDILLFEPTASGPRLVGVEWLQVDQDQDLTTDDDRPLLAGTPFDGPMLGHEPGMPIHYDLHVYLWKHNPAGVASPYNPRVSC